MWHGYADFRYEPLFDIVIRSIFKGYAGIRTILIFPLTDSSFNVTDKRVSQLYCKKIIIDYS